MDESTEMFVEGCSDKKKSALGNKVSDKKIEVFESRFYTNGNGTQSLFSSEKPGQEAKMNGEQNSMNCDMKPGNI